MRHRWAPWGLVLLACVGYGYATEPPASESLKTLEKRADRGDRAAEYALGKMYVEGRGVRLDEGEAAREYRKAAEQAYASALHELAQAYATGRGVPADDVEAYLWMDLAAFRARGALREQCSAERDALARTMSPEQVAQAERRGVEWKRNGLRSQTVCVPLQTPADAGAHA